VAAAPAETSPEAAPRASRQQEIVPGVVTWALIVSPVVL
jgi:hypothetical protein